MGGVTRIPWPLVLLAIVFLIAYGGLMVIDLLGLK
jgi:hypothetical protein